MYSLDVRNSRLMIDVNGQLKSKINKVPPSFFLFHLSLEARAEICKKFRWYFGQNDGTHQKDILKLTDL
jgi:hypothetical protein